LKTASNRQDANRNPILIRRQIGIGQPPAAPAKPEVWPNPQPESTAKQPENFGAIISRDHMITMQATEVLRLQLRPRCEQEQRDTADTAVTQPARRRIRAELRQGK
jgi:hypothetical protein